MNQHVQLSDEAAFAVKDAERACAVLNTAIDEVRKLGFIVDLRKSAIESTQFLELHIEAVVGAPTVDDWRERFYKTGFSTSGDPSARPSHGA